MHRQTMLMRASYANLQKALKTQQTGEGTDLDAAIKELSVKEAELDDWRREAKVKEELIERLKASDAKKEAEIRKLEKSLEGVRQMARRVNDVLKQRDAAEFWVEAEKEAAESAKVQLEEMQAALTKLQGEYARLQESSTITNNECARLKESLAAAESKITHLESEAHESRIINEYHSSTVGRLETAVACKARYEYLEAQLPAKLRDGPSQFRYPPIIAPYLDILSDVEREGGGYDLGEGAPEGEVEGEESDDDQEGSGDWSKEEEEETTKEVGESSTREVDSSLLGEKEKEWVEKEAPLTPPPAANVSLPLTPGANMNFP